MQDDVRTLFIQLGKTQIDGLFTRQNEGPSDRRFLFLPLVETVLRAFEKTFDDAAFAEELWEHAFFVYDQMCKDADPGSTTAENTELMSSYLLGTRRRNSRRP